MDKQIATLLPLFALPNHKTDWYGDALEFINWLQDTGQTGWQFLPISQTHFKVGKWNESPYSGYGIGISRLYYQDAAENISESDLEWRKINADWVEDYGLFLAIARVCETDYWPVWPEEYKDVSEESLAVLRRKFRSEIDEEISVQAKLAFLFRQFKFEANKRGVKLIGDLPFFLSVNSPLVWRYRAAFELNDDGTMDFVSGALGGRHFVRQFWGMPLYNWRSDYWHPDAEKIWKLRLRQAGDMFDVVRLDAGIRFYNYAKLSNEGAECDEVAKGPGGELFMPLVKELLDRGVEVFVEDVADFDLTELHRDLDQLKISGISVLVMAVAPGDTKFNNRYFRTDLFETNHLFYTSSHDMEPLVGFIENLSSEARKLWAGGIGLDSAMSDRELAKSARQLVIDRSTRCVIPVQDWLLSSERINTPGIVWSNNWSYVLPVPIGELPKDLF